MIVFSLNCRGLKDHQRLQIFVNQCLQKRSDLDNLCICLQETKITNITKNHLKILEDYHLSYNIYPSEGQSGGLSTIFPENYIPLNTHKSSNTISIHFSQHNFTLTDTYIKTTDYHLQQFSTDIFTIENFHCNTHIISGEFNTLPSSDCTSNRHVANNDFRLLRYHRIIDILHNLHVVRLSLEISNVTMTGTSYWKLNINALQHHDYITGIISDSLQTSHKPKNFDSHHYDLVKNNMTDRLHPLCISCTDN